MNGEIDVTALEPFPPDFFLSDVATVAKKLIGTFLFTTWSGTFTGGMIIETEAYDQNDPAAHCYSPNGQRPSKLGAAETMFREGGVVYVYATQFDWCLNFVSDKQGFGSAVL